MASATPLLRWLLSSGADASGRMLLQVVGTVLFTRLLTVADFGLAALIAVYVGALSMVVTGLFEEAIAQRRIIRKAHLSAALAAVLLLAAVLWLLVLAVSPLQASVDGIAIGGLSPLALYALILFADGPLSIFTAAARRQRRFGDVALGNLAGLTFGTATGLLLAVAGAGVWSLLAVQPVARLVNLGVMIARCPVAIPPRLAWPPLRQLGGYGGWHMAGRMVEGAADALFQTLVTRHFGVEGNGYLNMAQRIIEPIRGATSAIGHNLSMAHFARAQAAPAALGGAVRQTIVETALVLQPVFLGLAAVGPLAILVIGGPDWTAAGPLAVTLALAAAVGSVSNFVHGGIAARGRADIGFAMCVLELLTSCGLLMLLAPFGLAAIGLARLLAWLIDAAVVLGIARRLLRVDLPVLLRGLLPTAATTAAMAIAVIAAQAMLSGVPALPRLLAAIGIGIAVYGGLVLRFQAALLAQLRSRLRR